MSPDMCVLPKEMDASAADITIPSLANVVFPGFIWVFRVAYNAEEVARIVVGGQMFLEPSWMYTHAADITVDDTEVLILFSEGEFGGASEAVKGVGWFICGRFYVAGYAWGWCIEFLILHSALIGHRMGQHSHYPGVLLPTNMISLGKDVHLLVAHRTAPHRDNWLWFWFIVTLTAPSYVVPGREMIVPREDIDGHGANSTGPDH